MFFTRTPHIVIRTYKLMRTYMKSYMSRIKFHIKDKDVF